MGIYQKLAKIQEELKVPKNQFNSFGNYHYRSCEDILEAVKPICLKHKTVLMVHDNIIELAGRYYVRALVVLTDLEDEGMIVGEGLAREEEEKKGMDGSQITGTASSYARKYALNGLFCIDDTKDADSDEFHKMTNKQSKGKSTQKQDDRKASEAQIMMLLSVAKGDKSVFATCAKEFGYSSSQEILAKDVNAIKATIEQKRGGSQNG